MISKKQSVLMIVTLCTLLVPTLGNARGPGQQGRSAFPSFIPLDRTQGEVPEGVAVDKVGNVFVSIGGPGGPRGEIWKFTPSGEKSVLIDFGTPGVTGLAVDAIGNVYVARGVAPNNGVYRVDRKGQAVRLPGTEQMVFPNSLAFDQRGNLYVTESFSFDEPLMDYPGCNPEIPAYGQGGIWRIPPGGNAERWVRDDLLTGLCPVPFAIPFPAGANGLGYHHGALYAANTDKGIVVRVAILRDGEAGTPALVAQVPDPDPTMLPTMGPPMVDGLTLDVHGNIYVPVINRSAVVRLSPDGQAWQTVGTAADFLDMPASLAFGTGKGERQSLFASNLAMMPGGAGPGLVKIDVEIPGLPLP